jgi:hypothetical protein
MAATLTFSPLTDDIKRDRWGRPLIEPADGGKPIPYTRVSTLSKALDDKSALAKWMCRQTAIGLATRPDLISLVASDPESRLTVGDAVEQAMDAAKSKKAANIGTTLHKLAEHVDAGKEPNNMHGHEADLIAYRDAMAGIEVIASEQFVVCDEVQAAGTFDRLVRLPDGRIVVADIKTGQHEPKYPHAATIQVSVYAHGHLYDPARGRLAYLPDEGICTDTGLLIHLPAGQARCDLYLLDLNVGWQLAQTAVTVRQIFKAKPLTPYAPAS